MRELKKLAEAVSARIHKLEEELEKERSEITDMRIQWWQRYNDAIINQRETEFGEMVSYLYTQLNIADNSIERSYELAEIAEKCLDEYVSCFDDVIV